MKKILIVIAIAITILVAFQYEQNPETSAVDTGKLIISGNVIQCK